jgi:hypothetical protein
MTSGQEGGQPPYGQPPQGAPPYGAPPQGQPPQGQPPYGQPPQGQPPQGQPPQGQPPQGQPPYGPPPQGPPPYGYPPYGGPGPGYQPAPMAPSGWGAEAPRPVERPVTVRAGLGAFIASLVLSAVGSIVTVANWDRFVSYVQAQAEAQGQVDTGGTNLDTQQIAELGLRLGIIFSFVFVALYLLFIWFAWRGYNWARIVLWVLGGLGVVVGLLGLSAGSTAGPFPFLTALGWFQLLLTAAGVVLLAAKPSHDWYRYRKWLRATGQPG